MFILDNIGGIIISLNYFMTIYVILGTGPNNKNNGNVITPIYALQYTPYNIS